MVQTNFKHECTSNNQMLLTDGTPDTLRSTHCFDECKFVNMQIPTGYWLMPFQNKRSNTRECCCKLKIVTLAEAKMPQFQSSGLIISNILESLKDSTDHFNVTEVRRLKFIGHERYRGELFMLFVMSYSPSPR